MWRKKSQGKQPHRQGTESKALEQLERNCASFSYPEDGFVQKIECSLIYTMLSTPETYPKEVVNAMIDEEDFLQYIHTTNGNVSYAQLSAILAYSVENYSHKSSTEKKKGDDKEDISVSQKFCKKVLQAVVQYTEENNLDRETELNDLLGSIKTVVTQRIAKKEMKAILPFYLGYSVALITANPLPLIVGAIGVAAAPRSNEDVKNMEHIINATDRVSDVETAGLLDEGEDF